MPSAYLNSRSAPSESSSEGIQTGVRTAAFALVAPGAATTAGFGAARRGALGTGRAVGSGADGSETTTGTMAGVRATRAFGAARGVVGPDGASPLAGPAVTSCRGGFLRGGALLRTSVGFAAGSGSGIAGDSVRGEAGRRGKGSGRDMSASYCSPRTRSTRQGNQSVTGIPALECCGDEIDAADRHPDGRLRRQRG
jgi:hypothetical protein